MSFTSVRTGPMARTAMQLKTSLLNPTMPIWAGPSRDTATERSRLPQPLLSTLPLRSADGTMELSPSPLNFGLKLILGLTLLEPVFASTTGSTNARDGPMVCGVRWVGYEPEEGTYWSDC